MATVSACRKITPTNYTAGIGMNIYNICFPMSHTIVISRTLPESLAVFLEVVQMKDYFPEGSALAVNAHARETERTKQDVLREFLNGRSYHKIVAIGDSPQDIQLTSVGGGVSYLYAHPVRTFPACSADYRIRDLREILR